MCLWTTVGVLVHQNSVLALHCRCVSAPVYIYFNTNVDVLYTSIGVFIKASRISKLTFSDVCVLALELINCLKIPCHLSVILNMLLLIGCSLNCSSVT